MSKACMGRASDGQPPDRTEGSHRNAQEQEALVTHCAETLQSLMAAFVTRSERAFLNNCLERCQLVF